MTLPDWDETWALEPHHLYFAPRQHMFDFSNMLLNMAAVELELTGELSLDDQWADQFKQVITEGYPPLNSLGTLTTQCFYNEIASQQRSDCGDSVGLFFEQNRCYFSYRANASKAGIEAAYRKHVLQYMINLMKLPLSIVNKGDNFFLTHTAQGSLWISQSSGLRGKDPSGFRCEITRFDLDALLSEMAQFLSDYSSKQFSYSWQLHLRSEHLPQHAELLAKSIHAGVFPASHYAVRLAVTIPSISSLNSVHSAMMTGDTAVIRLGSFSDPDNKQHQLEALIDQGGFKIGVTSECEDAGGISAILASLGATLRPSS